MAFFAASLSIGINPASAEGVEDQVVAIAAVEYAVVSGHAPQSSIANQPSYWCGDGWKVEGKGLGDVRTYLLPELPAGGTYSRVIVKAGSGPTANTIFAAPPVAGQTVWADFAPSEVGTNQGPREGDKTISHIIVCPGPLPEKTDLTVTKVWAGEAPEDFLKSLTNADAGALSVTVDSVLIEEPAPVWGSPIEDLPVGVKAGVFEGELPALPSLEGYTCEVTGSPMYSVNGGAFEESASFTLQATSNTVKVRNTVTCSKDEKPTTSLKVVKQWVPGNGVPPEYPKLDSDNAGTLTVTVNADPTKQSWNDVKLGLPIGGSAVVSESKPTLDPFTGYECTVSNPQYVVNGGSPVNTAEFTLRAESNTVTVVNSFDCTKLVTPPAVTPPAVTPPAVTPPVVTQPVTDVTEGAVVGTEEDEVVDTTEEAAVAGEEDELAATGGNTSAALLGALLVLSGAALIGSRRRFGMNS